MSIKSYIPITDWLPQYNKRRLKGDLLAGITVGVMLIPQGMAYAMLAGLPPIYGLYASTIPLLLYAVLGTSRHLAVGPVAMVSLLVAAGVGLLAEQGTAEYIQLAIALALMVGVIQLLMGVFRLGFLVNFVSHPVISGFTSAAALIIGFSQLKHLLGINIPRSNHVHEIIKNAFANASEINWMTLIVGLVAIFLIMGVKKIKFPVPGPLLAVLLGILAVWGFGLAEYGLKIVKEVPAGLPDLMIPQFQMNDLSELLPVALTISFIGFMESIAIAKAIQSKHMDGPLEDRYQIKPNQELISLGIANIGGSFFQSFPVTGGFSRTAVNNQAGALTGMAAIVSAVLIILTLLFLTPLFYYLPNAILAAVIMVAVFSLINVKEAIHLWHAHRTDFWMLIATFLGTLLLGIEEGILIGVVLSLGMLIYKTTRPHMAVLGRVPETTHYRNVERFDNLECREDILVVRFDARLYYANTNYFQDKLEEFMYQKRKSLKLFILDADSINGIDSTGVHALETFYDHCLQHDIDLYFVGLKGPVRDVLYKSGFYNKYDKDIYFIRVQDAIDHFDQKSKHDFKDYALQSNANNKS